MAGTLVSEAAPHPRLELVPEFSHPVRLSIAAGLQSLDRSEFAAVRDAVQVSDSVLSKQVAVLEQAGIVSVKKGYVGKRPRTWLSLSPQGRTLLTRHLDALRRIADGS